MSQRTDALFAALRAAQGRIVLAGHDQPDVDSILSCELMRRFLSRAGIDAAIVLETPADEQSARIAQAMGADVSAMAGKIAPQDSVVLLDHYEPQHAGRVIACIDHHPTMQPLNYPYVQIEPAGACANMVLALMREAGMDVMPQDERLAVCALYLDTIALRSTKIAPQEAAWAEATARRLGMDIAWLEREGMSLADLTQPVHALATGGLKRHSFGGSVVMSSYVQTDAMTPALLEAILNEIREELANCGADEWVFLIHDPRRMRSRQINLYADGHRKQIDYDFLASRGKDVMPQVERERMEAMRGE